MTEAEYYSGLAPQSEKGVLSAEPGGITFEGTGPGGRSSRSFSYGEILTVEKSGKTCRVSLKSPDPRSANQLLVFNDPALYRQILQYHKEQRVTAPVTTPRLAADSSNVPVIALLLVLFGLFCAGGYLLLTRAYLLVPVSVDKQLGKIVSQQVLGTQAQYRNPQLDAVLARIAARVIPKQTPYTYTIKVVDNPEQNAFALPDGTIVIFSGLVKASEKPDEVAGVLAHEVSHVEKRHGMRQIVRALGISFIVSLALGAGLEQIEIARTIGDLSTLLIILKYSRAFEKEADLNAVTLLHNGKISAKGLTSFFTRMSKEEKQMALPGWAVTHPLPAQRIEYLSDMLKKENLRAVPILRRGESWRAITGI